MSSAVSSSSQEPSMEAEQPEHQARDDHGSTEESVDGAGGAEGAGGGGAEERLREGAEEAAETSEGGAAGGQTGGEQEKEGEEEEGQKAFECNICLDVARDAVISLCGHLFCWPCLHQWLETRPHRQICPVCKAGISRDKVIPLYGRGNTDQKDPRDKVPPRPRGRRPEPENTGGGGGFFNPFNMGGNQGAGGFQMSFGIGAFPFGFFATNFNLGDGGPRHRHPHNPMQTAQMEEEQFLQRIFLWVALAFIFWLMMA